MHQCWHESYGSAAKLLLSHTAAQDKNTSVNRACLSCMVYATNTKSAKMQGFPSLWVSQSLGWLLCPSAALCKPTSLLPCFCQEREGSDQGHCHGLVVWFIDEQHLGACVLCCSVVFDSATPWTAACQAPLSIFQATLLEWVAISSSWYLPDPGIEPTYPELAGGFFTPTPPGKSWSTLLREF